MVVVTVVVTGSQISNPQFSNLQFPIRPSNPQRPLSTGACAACYCFRLCGFCVFRQPEKEAQKPYKREIAS